MSEELDRLLTDVIRLVPHHHAPKADAPQGLASWLAAAAIPIPVDPTADLCSSEPLLAALRGARCIGLGEASHGTSEFFTMKHSMIRLLAEQGGLTGVSFEAFPGECLVVDDYVNTGEGDPEAAVRLIYGGGFPWDVHEVLDLVAWLREHNLGHPERPVSFTGFDSIGHSSVTPLARCLDGLDPELAAAAESLRPLASPRRMQDVLASPESRAEQAKALAVIGDELDARRGDLVRSRGDRAWKRARRMAYAAALLVAAPPDPSLPPYYARDRVMAEHAKFLLDLDGPDARLALWAHDGHLFRGSFFTGDVPPAGGHLAEMLGEEYAAVGFAFGDGSFRGRILDDTHLPQHFALAPSPPDTFDGALAAGPGPSYAIDLRTAPGDVATWLKRDQAKRYLAAGFSQTVPQWLSVVPVDDYDVVAYVRRTTGARPLAPWPDPVAPTPVAASISPLDLADRDASGRPRSWQVSLGDAPAEYRLGGDRDAVTVSRRCPWSSGAASLSQHVVASAFAGRIRATFALGGSWPAVGSDAEVFIEQRADGRPVASAYELVDAGPGRPVTVEAELTEDATSVVVGVRLFGDGELTVTGFAAG